MLTSVRTENFTGSASSTNTSRVWAIPLWLRAKRVTPAACVITKRPLVLLRRTGPGVGDHVSPDSSSRMNHASAVGSATGSLANDVRRFSRLFSDHVIRRPRRRDDGAEAVVRDHVRPWQRRLPISLEHRQVGVTVFSEATEVVGEGERRHGHGLVNGTCIRRVGARRLDQGIEPADEWLLCVRPIELCAQIAAVAAEAPRAPPIPAMPVRPR